MPTSITSIQSHHPTNAVSLGTTETRNRCFYLLYFGISLAGSLLACSVQAETIDSSVGSYRLRGRDTVTIVPGGDVSFFDAYDESRVSITGGEVSFIDAYNASQISITGGEVSWVHTYSNANVDVTGGDISWIIANDRSTVRITGVEELSWLQLYGEDARAEIVVSDVSYESGILSGTWEDGSLFEFWAVRGDWLNQGHIPSELPGNFVVRFVPEPHSFALMILTFFAVTLVTRKNS